MNSTELRYRKGVVALIRNEAGLYLFGRMRNPEKPGWQFPQGGIEPGEDPETAVHREIREEIGVSGLYVRSRTTQWIPYEWPESMQGALIGQMHIYFLLESAQLSPIEPSITDDFDAYEWLSPQEILARCLDFKRHAYERAFTELSIR